ncbi:MAG TPA: hypothetical protein VJG32_21815 [Anaerolineae bacterium]|nr:hypothetical protein [Anaerolineae bacterium]
MTVMSASLSETRYVRSGGERDVVACLIRTAAEAGVRADPISIINFYVALKSTPLVILTGLAQSGKIALVQSVSRVLSGGDPLCCQMMIGHARWASQTRHVALFAEAQTRLNADKIFALIDEAWQPENTERVFIACLTRIGQAELAGFFSEVAFQLRHGQIMRLPSAHLTEPIPYPPNLFLIGTLDDFQPVEFDADLLLQTTVIRWPALEIGPAADTRRSAAVPHGENAFLSACIRSAAAARLKLYRLLCGRTQAIGSLLQVEDVLKQHAVELPAVARHKAVVYLANAWSKDGIGLFDPAPRSNLAIATDLTMAQTVLPFVGEAIRHSTALRSELIAALNGRFPRAVAYLKSLYEVSERGRPVNSDAV